MTDSESPTFWDNHIRKFKASKLTKREYCEANGLNPRALSNHIYFKKKKQQTTAKDPGFVKALIDQSSEPSEKATIPKKAVARLITRGGMVLEFDTNTPPEWIGTILRTAERT